MQPPSRGCVLKQDLPYEPHQKLTAAAFARLCVETRLADKGQATAQAAAFARLCVETLQVTHKSRIAIAAAFARLCVETRCIYQSTH